jgi:hypothetical protein
MSFGGTSPPVVRHFLLCQHVEYDFDNPTAPYSLQGVVTSLGPEPGNGYPFLVDVLWVFAQGAGDPGEYDVWVDLVPLDDDGDDADEPTPFGPLRWIIHEDVYVESRAWVIRFVPFRSAGLYLVRLRCGPDILAEEELLLEEA